MVERRRRLARWRPQPEFVSPLAMGLFRRSSAGSALAGYRHAVAHVDRRSGAAVAVFAAALAALTACAGSPAPQSTSPSSAKTVASAKSPARATSTVEPQPLDREVSTYTGFISPTGNVSCAIDVDLARCDIIDRDWSPPPRPADCEFDYGQGIQMVPGESASFVCAGDTAFGAEDVLPYGEAITAGPLRCESADSGITCRDTESEHGFTISREAYDLS